MKSALSVLASGLMLSACAGENLFSLSAGFGELGPQVEITSPTEGATIAPGDSIRITADINASSGVASVSYSGSYTTSGEAAYTPEDKSLDGANQTESVSNFLLAAAGQDPGAVYLKVEATDLLGETGADSVRITIVQN